MRSKFNIYLLFCLQFALKAQMPDTDLWLFKIEKDKLGQYKLKEGINITNRNGYDNQPSFSLDGKKIYYVSVREDKQADVYYYDIKSKKNVQLTKSKESEYSPVLSPEGRHLSSVVVEMDSAQRIHLINAELGFDEKKFEFDSVGYYTFLNSDTIIYYKLTQPHSLRVFSTSNGEDKWLADSPIRAFKAQNRNTLLYGIKNQEKVIFYKYDFLLHKAEKYTEYPSLNEDMIWHPELGLLKSEELKLIRFDETKKEWALFYDLSPFNLKKITRFAFDAKNKYLVVVNNL